MWWIDCEGCVCGGIMIEILHNAAPGKCSESNAIHIQYWMDEYFDWYRDIDNMQTWKSNKAAIL